MKKYTKEITLYEFDELSDEAKEKAREWWREGLMYDEWWDGVYMDAERVHLEITSFDLYSADITGRFTIEPHLAADEILNEHGTECETHKTATAFLAERDKLVNEAPRDDDGELEDERELDAKLDELEEEFLHDILEDYLSMLRKEEEWLLSDEQVDESIRINEYTFNERGERED